MLTVSTLRVFAFELLAFASVHGFFFGVFFNAREFVLRSPFFYISNKEASDFSADTSGIFFRSILHILFSHPFVFTRLVPTATWIEKRAPQHVEKSEKYTKDGDYSSHSFQHLNVNNQLKALLAETSNFSLAKATWSTYRTARKQWERFGLETGTDTTLPASQPAALGFTAWLLNRGVGTSTVNSYLSGLRQAHLTQGLDPPKLHSDLVDQVLQGKSHLENLDRLNKVKPVRLPVTITLLNLLKLELERSPFHPSDKKLYLAVSLIAFSGAFRPGELLTSKEWHFDKSVNLLQKDIKETSISLNGERIPILQIKLKAEKQNKKGSFSLVDVYSSKGDLCPVNAYRSWKLIAPHQEKEGPAFCKQNGAALTKSHFNKILKTTLQRHTEGLNGYVTGHSFRIGISSLLGSLGHHEDDIMSAGRWSSNAYCAYLKMPRTRRRFIARQISTAVN